MQDPGLGSPLPTSPSPFSLWQRELARTLAFTGLGFPISPTGWGRWLRPGPPPSPSSGGVGELKQSPRLPGIAAQGGRAGVVSVRAAALLQPLPGPWVPVWSLRPHTVPTPLQPSTNFLLKARLVPSAPPSHCHSPRSCQVIGAGAGGGGAGVNPGDQWGCPPVTHAGGRSPEGSAIWWQRVNRQVRPPLRGGADGLSVLIAHTSPLIRGREAVP